MRIAIDARYLSHGLVGGVRTYTHNLILALLRQDRTNQYVLWADTKSTFEITELPSNAEVRTLPWNGPLDSARNDRLIGTAMLRAGADLAHFPANVGLAPGWMPRVITLHDAINVLPLTEIIRGHRKDPKTILTMTYLHAMTRKSLQRQPTIITVSEYSRREILKHTGLDPETVRAVHSAPDPSFRRLPDGDIAAFLHEAGLTRQIVLADAIKNPISVLRAFRTLRPELRERSDLVFFSRREPCADVLASAHRGECRVILRPPTEDLARLYNAATAFVFPSLYEGFGLPVLEAMACGAPVITSDRGSLPEVAGPCSILTGADDTRGIAAALTRVLSDESFAERMRREGMEWAGQFTWDATARGVLDVYTAAAGNAPALVAPARLAAV